MEKNKRKFAVYGHDGNWGNTLSPEMAKALMEAGSAITDAWVQGSFPDAPMINRLYEVLSKAREEMG